MERGAFDLGRRERQIMEIVYAREEVSVADVLKALPDPPSYSAVRAMLRLLETKGHVRHREVGRRFVYVPALAQDKVRRSALETMLRTFFGGSVTKAVASLIEMDREKLTPQDFERLAGMIEDARKEGR